jgi:hypothetical protein
MNVANGAGTPHRADNVTRDRPCSSSKSLFPWEDRPLIRKKEDPPAQGRGVVYP